MTGELLRCLGRKGQLFGFTVSKFFFKVFVEKHAVVDFLRNTQLWKIHENYRRIQDWEFRADPIMDFNIEVLSVQCFGWLNIV